MKIAVLGTGAVGRTLAGRLAGLGHDVAVGTRDVEATLTRVEPGAMGTPPFTQWRKEHADVGLDTFRAAAGHGEIVVNATAGQVSLAVLEAAGAESLAGKVLVDVANPLDFSRGMPPKLSVANTDSLAEQIQREFPRSRVVKTLNTVNAMVMVDPARVPGEHNVFVAGDDDAAKETVRQLLQELGWTGALIVDLGGIQAARAMEMYLPLWLALMGRLGSPDFNIRVVKA